MNVVEYANDLVDLESAKKISLYLSLAFVLVIPADAFLIYFCSPKPIRIAPTVQDKPATKTEPEESYLTNFDRSAVFGNASPGLSTPALQASLTELTKDYRLQGVVLTDEPEAIIQDARTQKTVFVKIGGQLGELTVKEIKEGLIVLQYLGEEIKLEIQ
jgi:hypothetical protein